MRPAYANACLPLLCALSAAVRGSGGSGPTAARTDAAPRLPGHTSPVSYDLRFDLASPVSAARPDAFDGVARITTVVRSSTDVITLNARDLTVTNVTVTDVSGQTAGSSPRWLRVHGWAILKRNEWLTVKLDGPVPRGRKLEVTVRYRGKFRTDQTGFFSVRTDDGSSDEDGNNKWSGWSIVTQFESTFARRAFPCYDEPSYKARFNITVIRREDQIALSNMPIRNSVQQKDTVVICFTATPPMSTYMVAIYVGKLVPNPGNDSRVTVYTSKDHADQATYIVTEASKHLDALSKYTGIDYMLPKMDMLALPGLSSEAMENWGLNIYQEELILLNDESKTEAKIRASEIIQHEFTQQWFGNLVTCSWWDYAWLNKGFAQYFQYFATQMVNEDWPMEEWFLVEIHQRALAYDQSPRHPIVSSVNTPEEIEGLFDDITFKKAASVIRMLRCLVTENLFQKSLRRYILWNQKGLVAEPKNLYENFEFVLYDNKYELPDGITIYDFMSNWTLQSGYPVLNITKNETLKTFLVTQDRFCIKSNEINLNTSAVWLIGLTYTTKSEKNFSNTRPSIWIKEPSKLIKAPILNSGWYIFNVQSTGFYRVNYDTDNWNALIEQLIEDHDDIHVLNRAQLIDDAFSLARAGYLDYSIPLNLSKYLKKENNTTPWYSAINHFSYLIERIYRSDEGFENIKTYFSELVGSIYGKLDDLVLSGNIDFNVAKNWDVVSTWACVLENADCVKNALEYFEAWKSEEKIPADIKDAAFCVGIKNSIDPIIFNKMFNLFTETTSYSEKTSIEWALGCSTNRTQLNEYINHVLDSPYGPINERNYKSVITAISNTHLGLTVLYEFLSTNLNKIIYEVSNGEEIAKFIFDTLAAKISKDDEIEKIRNLKNNSNSPLSVRRSFEKSYEKVIDNQLWFDTYTDIIIRWLMENSEVDSTTVITSTSVEYTSSLVSGESSPITSDSSMMTDEFSTLPVSEQSVPTTYETTWTTDEYFTSTESKHKTPSTSKITWTTDESFTSPGSKELSSSTSETTWTTEEFSTTPVDSGSSQLHYSFIIILIFSTMVLFVYT